MIGPAFRWPFPFVLCSAYYIRFARVPQARVLIYYPMKKAISIYRNCVVLLFLLQFVSNCSPEDDGGSGEEEV